MTAHILPHPAAGPDVAEWWRGAVIYQVYPRSFADSNGDGVGDLKGVADHLDHIASLGVDAVWLSPFYTSPMRDFGYDVADYCDIDPIFGTLADFDALVAKAHGLGLRVITDLVFAHTSDHHAWFRESRQSRTGPKADWYVWADARPDGSPPTNWQSVFGGPAWTWDARRGQYYMHNFLPEQPQLNVHNPAVQDALLDVARFWLDRGVDGFRFDAINFSMHDPALRDNPPLPPGGKRTRPFDFQDKVHNQSHPAIADFLKRIRALTDSYGGRFSVAEVGGDHAVGRREPRVGVGGAERRVVARLGDALLDRRLVAERADPGDAGAAVADDAHAQAGGVGLHEVLDLAVRRPDLGVVAPGDDGLELLARLRPTDDGVRDRQQLLGGHAGRRRGAGIAPACHVGRRAPARPGAR